MSVAKLLAFEFEGYFLCRLATDPDPTNERRGASGYTMALAGEPDMDQVIRLQLDEEQKRQLLREPAEANGIVPGVKVTGVKFDGQPWAKGASLHGAKVNLVGRSSSFTGPTFQSRNNIVGSDDTMAFAVDPFDLRIEDNTGGIRAVDFLDPADAARFHERGSYKDLGPEEGHFQTTEIWQITDPTIYQRRLPVAFNGTSQEAEEAIGVFDQYRYFRDRRRYLDVLISELESAKPEGWETRVQAARSRIYQLETWGWRVANKLAFQSSWQHGINGVRKISREWEAQLGGTVGDSPWTATYWFGSWDGDLLTGYMRGSLTMPFAPE
jgi:hypothetical protein